MANRRSGDLSKQLQTLFQHGTVGGLSDAQLLDQFVAQRDEAGEAAFRALVARHGPMVLGVCRSVLHDEHDAEDAFQVTFLVLARKAGTIRKQRSLGSWLHGVAHHVAVRARTAARRRRAHESKVAEMAAASPEPGRDVDDRSPVLHQEIERLPAKYRAPIVLCYLEGMTHDQAARELDWPIGTVRGRLARARDLLRSRLTRRGLTLSAGLAAAGSLPETASAAVPSALLEATIKAALASTTAGILTRTATLLLKVVLRDMARGRLVQLAAPLVMIALVASGTAMLASSGRMKLSGERPPIAMIAPVRPPAPTDLAGDLLPDGALARLGSTRFLHAASPTQIAYAPDGATLASFDGDLYLWDPSTGRERHRIETGAGHGIGHVQFAFAPDGQSLAVIAQEVGNRIAPGEGHEVFPWTDLYDSRTGRKIRRFAGGGMDDGLAFSPDGRVLAGAGFLDGKPVITFLEVASGRVIRRIGSLPNAPPRPLAFLPEGKFLFYCVSWRESESKYDDMTGRPMESAIYLREVATGKEIRHIQIGKTIINDAVLAPDGKTVATATTDQTVRLWDLITGRELRRFGRANTDSDHLAFSPDGTKLASAEKRMSSSPISTGPPMTPIHIWDAATGRELRHWETDNASQIGFSPDGTTLASVGGGSQVIRLWDVATGREIRPETRLGHHSAIEDAAFAPDGRSIVTVGRDRTIRFWDPATGKEVRRLGDDDLDLRFTALSADGRTLATGGGFQPTRLWDVASGRELRRFQMTDEPSLERADLSPDGNTPATSADDAIREPFVECADLSPDGQTLATSWNDRLILWDTATGRGKAGVDKSPLVPRFVTKLVKALRFAPDGQSVATLGGHWIRIWDVASAGETRRIVMPNAPPWRPGAPARPPLDEMNGAYLAFSPDGKILAASSQQDGQVCLIDMASGKEIARLDGPGGLKALAFSPDGKVLATGMETGEKRGRACSIRLWDVTERRELCRVEAHRSGISALAFSPDGRRLLSASADATALVWDAAALIGRGTPPADDRRGEGVRKE